MSLIFATQLTATATVALAVFAIVTAWYARKAFIKQSKEVSDQAEMLRIQGEQLTEQRSVNERQIEVLELQAGELRASLEAREQASLAMRYQYASTVVAWQDEPEIFGEERLVAAYVLNTGKRPVRDVTAQWYVDGEEAGDPEQLAAILLPGVQKDFVCRLGGADCTAIVEFRTVGEDWWRTGTDGTLAGGMDVRDTPSP